MTGTAQMSPINVTNLAEILQICIVKFDSFLFVLAKSLNIFLCH
jgi:hypothetical protein